MIGKRVALNIKRLAHKEIQLPIPVKCNHCGTESNAPDQYAGTSGPCRGCGQTIVIPGIPGAAHVTAPNASIPNATISEATVGRESGGFGWIIALVLGVVTLGGLVVFGLLMALLFPAAHSARTAARAAMCTNNVKRINLAILNYEATHGTLPPAYSVDQNGKPLHSWRVLVLPYLEEQDIYEQFDLTEPWNSPHNLSISEAYMPDCFCCPESATATTETSYLGVAGPNAVFASPPRRISNISDGTSKTIMVVEVENSGVHWTAPKDWDANSTSFLVNGGANEIGSSHANGGAHIGLVDGSVQIVDETTSPLELEAMTTIAGND